MHQLLTVLGEYSGSIVGQMLLLYAYLHESSNIHRDSAQQCTFVCNIKEFKCTVGL